MSSPDMIAKSDAHALVLASGSEVRTRLLTSAGVPHIVDPSDVDEASVRDKMLVENATHVSIAEALAELKAHRVSAKHEGCIVIGADQVLSCDGALFEKPADLDGVRAHLKRLMGKEHTLHASVCAVLDGDVIWHVNADAVLHMRELSDTFMDYYVETVGEAACQSVGAYLLEGLGIQLFSSIDDDFFTILGLPMLPLLEFLRSNNVIER
jgi:septum formation protein